MDHDAADCMNQNPEYIPRIDGHPSICMEPYPALVERNLEDAREIQERIYLRNSDRSSSFRMRFRAYLSYLPKDRMVETIERFRAAGHLDNWSSWLVVGAEDIGRAQQNED